MPLQRTWNPRPLYSLPNPKTALRTVGVMTGLWFGPLVNDQAVKFQGNAGATLDSVDICANGVFQQVVEAGSLTRMQW